MVGKKGVFPPGQNATPEMWKDFFKQVGQPDLEKFELKLPEGKKVNPDAAGAFKKMAHELGLLPHQAQALMDWQIGQEEGIQTSRVKEMQAQKQQQLDDLKKEWGQGYDKELRKAQAAIKELGGESFQKYLLTTGLGDDVNLVRFAAKAGALLGEDKLRGDGSGKFGKTPTELQEEINRTLGDKSGPYWNKNHPSHKDAVRQQEERYKALAQR